MKLNDLLEVLDDYQEIEIGSCYFLKNDLLGSLITDSEIRNITSDQEAVIHVKLY